MAVLGEQHDVLTARTKRSEVRTKKNKVRLKEDLSQVVHGLIFFFSSMEVREKESILF